MACVISYILLNCVNLAAILGRRQHLRFKSVLTEARGTVEYPSSLITRNPLVISDPFSRKDFAKSEKVIVHPAMLTMAISTHILWHTNPTQTALRAVSAPGDNSELFLFQLSDK